MSLFVPEKEFIDDDFLNNLDENITSLLNTMFTISGKHAINSEKADKWVNSQKTTLKRKVARHFIKNTNYVTFREYFHGIGKLIYDHYPTITKNAKQIILYVGTKNKSIYFSAIIAMHFIRKYKFTEPYYFINTLYSTNITDPILIIDDMAYSGSQMSNMMSKIYKDCVPKYTTDEAAKRATPDIHLLLYGLNSYSHTRLSEIENMVKIMVDVEYVYKGKTNTRKQMKYITVPSPFNLYFVKKFPLLIEIDMDMAHLINYFFSPYLKGNPPLSIYFDHKIADDVSTHMKVLSYGPIIPKSYAIEAFETNKQEVNDILGDILTVNNNSVDIITSSDLSNLNTKQIFDILQRYSEDDPIDLTDTLIKFSPFIHNCTINSTFINQLKGMSYNEFLFPEHEIQDMNVSDEITEKPDNFADIVRRSLVIHDDKYKCIQPFYKLSNNLRAIPKTRTLKARRSSIGGKKRKQNHRTFTKKQR